MGRGALAVAVGATAAVAAAAWFFLLGGGAPGGGPAAGEEGAVEEATDTGAPSLAGRAKAAPGPAARLADFRVKGKVVDVSGKPQRALRVTARRTGAVWDEDDPASWGEGPLASFRRALERHDAPKTEEPKPDAEATASEEGAFDLALPDAGQYEVRAWPAAPGVAFPAQVGVTVAKPLGTATILVIGGGALRVRVVDAKDAALSAVVQGWWAPDGGDRSWSLPSRRTDPGSGEAAWDAVPAGTGTLTVLVPGRGSYGGIEVKTPREDVLVVRIAGLGTVRGRVTDAEGRTVAGADVTITTGKGTATEGPASGTVRARTEADGTYRSDGAWPGKVTQAMAHAEGFTLLSQFPPRAPWSGAEVAEGKETTVDLVLSRGGAVAGRVTEVGTGAPVPDVELTLVRATRGGEWEGTPPTTRTDAEGRYRFEDVPLGKHVLFPRSRTHYFAPMEAARGQMDWSGSVPLAAPPSVLVVLTKEGETQERDLELAKGLAIRGRVVGPDGAPVAGASVHAVGGEMYNVAWRWGVQWNGGSGGPLATSGEDGTFTAGGLAPRADWSFRASKGNLFGVPSEPVALTADGGAPSVTLKLETGASLEGRVVDAEGKGVLGATTWFWNGSGAGGTASATTDADGAFLLEGLPPGKGQVQVSAGRRSVQKAIDEPLAAGERRRGVEFRIAAGNDVSGVVVDEQGKGVPGLSLSAQGGGNAWATTKSDGSFLLSGLEAGRTTIHVQEPTDQGYSTGRALGDPVAVPSSGVRLVYKARRTTTVVVRVTDPEGRPVPLCTVRIGAAPREMVWFGSGDADETVNGEARREVEGKPPFQVTASAARDARGLPLNLRSKSGEIADPAVPLTLALEPGAELAGVVVDPDGKGVEGVAVAGGGTTAVSDAQGRWRLAGLPGTDALDVTARPPPRWQAPPAVKARPGDPEVRFTLAPSAFVAGQVLGPDGQGVSQCSVAGQWRSASAGTNGQVHVNPDAGGRFRIEGFPADAIVNLEFRPYGTDGTTSLRTARVKDVPAGRDDVVVRLLAGVRIEGRALAADGTKPTNAWVQAVRADGAEDGGPSSMQWNEDGTFVLSGLAPGPYTLTFTGQTGPLAEPRRVDAPARGIDVRLPARVRLAGRLEGEGDLKGFAVRAWPAVPAGTPTYSPSFQAVDAQGAFSFDLPADAEVWLSASRNNDDRYALLGPVRVGSAGALTTLRLLAGVSVEGVLEDGAGAPAANVQLRAESDHFQAWARCDAQGRFRVRGLPAGRYRVVAYHAGKVHPLGEVEAGAADQRFRLPK